MMRLARWTARTGASFALALLGAGAAMAQSGAGAQALLPAGELVTGRIVQLVVVLTLLSLAPALLIMVTSFTRIVVALAFLRSGLGLQTTPANLILISLALFMTFFVMQPVFQQAWDEGVRPLMENRIGHEEAWKRTIAPFRAFMLEHVREKDLAMFRDLAERSAAGKTDRADGGGQGAAGQEGAGQEGADDDPRKVSLRILIPAFMISELRRGFEIGFLIALPFLVIDLIVATITMSMGMMMLPPTIISLPFKVLFFVLIDGWSLLTGGLVRSFA